MPRRIDVDQPFWLGMTARLCKIKDHATLLRAFRTVLGRFPNCRLELAGDGELRLSLEALARELGVFDSVKFLGDVVMCMM